ncbi:hypothetical protein ACCO45_004154 [Purpureocillium lilacinum]|uniref:Uncharacterized protein n=1 Tax=Purpureocillium lilacinum TaxID=33203 RepID=A0ACC4E2A8_PURLI
MGNLARHQLVRGGGDADGAHTSHAHSHNLASQAPPTKQGSSLIKSCRPTPAWPRSSWAGKGWTAQVGGSTASLRYSPGYLFFVGNAIVVAQGSWAIRADAVRATDPGCADLCQQPLSHASRYNVASPDIDGCAWTPQSSYGAIRRRSSDVFSVSPHRFVSCFISGLISATCTTTTRCILPTAGTRGHSTRIATKLSYHMPAGVSYSRQVGSQLVPRTRMTPSAFDTAPWLPGIDLGPNPIKRFFFDLHRR